MRREDDSATASPEQARVAGSGMKGMIPIGRPFLDYIVSSLADAGMTDVVLVIGPEHDAVRHHFTVEVPPSRVRLRFAVQPEPRGTADAVCAAAAVTGDIPFLVLNADNYYPVDAFRLLAAEATAGTIAFDSEALVREGNIDENRIASFAALEVSDDGRLVGLIEKPGVTADHASHARRWVGMNCWLVTPQIVDACRRVPLSVRGEYELPEAVCLAISEGAQVRAITLAAGVLDLSQRSDIAKVAAALHSVNPVP